MDVGLLEVRTPAETGNGLYEAWHPDSGGDFIGKGATPDEASRDLVGKAKKKFVASHRGPSQHVGGGPTATTSGDTLPGEVHHEAEGDTPQEAWDALNKNCSKQAPGCKAAHAGPSHRYR